MEKLKEKAEKNTKTGLKSRSEKSDKTEDLDGLEYTEPDSYSAKYSNVYKDYIE